MLQALVALLCAGVAASVPIPTLSRVCTIALDPTGHLRDPSSVVLANGTYYFVTDYIPLSQGTQAGWNAFLHLYSATNLTGPWTNHGLVFDHASDPDAFDSNGTLSSSIIYDQGRWYIFYTGTGSNYSTYQVSAQLVASSDSIFGPWTRHGLVAFPTGQPPLFNATWNARRVDSGRAMIVNGTRGYWTKGVKDVATAVEGVYFPVSRGSFLPPYREYAHNPVHPPLPWSPEGYENCEFFRGPTGLFHVICQDHGPGQPHFVADETALRWTYVGNVTTGDAGEPTPVYEGMPGPEAAVNYFIARTATEGIPTLHIDLYRVQWTT